MFLKSNFFDKHKLYVLSVGQSNPRDVFISLIYYGKKPVIVNFTDKDEEYIFNFHQLGSKLYGVYEIYCAESTTAMKFRNIKISATEITLFDTSVDYRV